MKRVFLSVISLFAINSGFSQNIGINATGANPDASAILDVSSTTKGMLIPRMTTANRTAITSPATGLVVYDTNLNSFYYYNGTSWTWLLNSTGGWSVLGNAATVAGTNFIGTTDAIDFVTKTNNTERLRVTSGGNVGIGTNAPVQKLNVVGDILLGTIAGTDGEHNDLEFSPDGGGTGAQLDYYNGALYFSNLNGTSNTLTIKDNADVGIGTAFPIAKLEVTGKIYSTGAGAECSAQDRTNGTQYTMYGSGGVMRFWRGDFGDLVGMTSTGDVGINTTAPANKLHVNSTTNTSMVQTSNANTGATATDGAVFGLFNSNAYLYNRENADLYFGTNNTRRMTITAGGNVGIGSAVITPAVPLAVGGVGANVYTTDIWSENNMHVQGNEGLLAGGRGRLRVGTAWNYVGLYSEGSSTGATNDLVLGASSAWVRIGPNGGGQNFAIPSGQLSLGVDNAVKPGTSTWIISSDERLKTINGSYTRGLAEILKLNTITYKYKNVGEKKFEDKVLETTQIGFSAQEVQKIFPEAVGVEADGYLNLNIHAILVAYVNAIKELDAKNKEQEKINSDLKQRLEKLEALLEKTK